MTAKPLYEKTSDGFNLNLKEIKIYQRLHHHDEMVFQKRICTFSLAVNILFATKTNMHIKIKFLFKVGKCPSKSTDYKACK